MSGPASRLVEVVAPSRLGTSFRWLTAAAWTSNLEDGIVLAAGPLLVASVTDSKFLVAMAALVQWLPPLLFGLVAGAVTDRVDRRTVVSVANLARAAVLAVIALEVGLGAVSPALILGALFLLGATEAFADNVTGALLPTLVEREDIPLGNARIQFGFITLNQLVGPPVGAALFAAGRIWPWMTGAALIGLAVVLVRRIAATPVEPVQATFGQDVVAGFRWAWRNPAVRTLVLTIFIFNITFGAAWSVLVLYARDRLGLGPIGFGLVTTVQAAGGLLGTTGYGWLTRRVSLGDIMRVGLIIETLTHLSLALTTSPWVAMPIFFVFGMHAFVWGTTSVAVRQRATPRQLQGRVASVNTVGVYGGLVLGSGVGGLLAQHLGVTAPFWFAGIGSAVFVVLLWGQLTHIAHAESRPSG